MRETQHIKFKSNFDDRVIETLSAFANTKGGRDMDTNSYTITPQATPQVRELLKILDREMNRAEIQEILKLNDRENFRRNYIQPALELEFIELVYPNSKRHPQQKYRLTKKAVEFLKNSKFEKVVET